MAVNCTVKNKYILYSYYAQISQHNTYFFGQESILKFHITPLTNAEVLDATLLKIDICINYCYYYLLLP